MFYDRDFKNPLFINKEIYKAKPLSAFPFRQLHRTLVEFHDVELQRECCRLANKVSVGDSVSFGYCCVDERLGLQIYILAALNRNGSSDYVFLIPEEKEIVLSYSEAKDKMACFSNCYPKPFGLSVERCRRIMKQHEHNPTIMCEDLDPFRDVEFPLDIQITIRGDGGTTEKVRFRPILKRSRNLLDGILLNEPENSNLHKGDSLTVRIIYNDKRRAVDVIQYLPNYWTAVNQGNSIGEIGPNNGIIFEDEEYNGQCRVTLEDCGYCFAIICILDKDLSHTVFYQKENAHRIYEKIKLEFQFFWDSFLGYDYNELYDFFDDFAERYQSEC